MLGWHHIGICGTLFGIFWVIVFPFSKHWLLVTHSARNSITKIAKHPVEGCSGGTVVEGCSGCDGG